MNTKIRGILKDKGHAVWAVPPSCFVYDAIAMMDDKRVGALAVKLDDQLVGIISERDYARKVILRDRSSKDTEVGEVMSTEIVSVGQDHTVKECMALMAQEKVRHLPVLDGEKLTGMISLGDMVTHIMKAQELSIGRLQSYTQALLIVGMTVVISVMLQISYG